MSRIALVIFCIVVIGWLYFHIAVMCSTCSIILFLSDERVVWLMINLLLLVLIIQVEITPWMPVVVCWIVVKEYTVLLVLEVCWVWLLSLLPLPFECNKAACDGDEQRDAE